VPPIVLSTPNSTGSLDPYIDVINDSFEFAASAARRLLGADDIDVVVFDAPEQTIPEWGVGGYTYGESVVLVAVDPTWEIERSKLVATMVHEFHHAMRWRGPGCGGTLGQMLVSEGLAELFEEEVVGEAPFYSKVEISDEEMTRALLELENRNFDQSKWFFGSSDVSRFFGYAYGYQICRTYSRRVGRSAAELVEVSTAEIISLTRP